NHEYTSNILNTPELDPEAYQRSSPIEYAEGLQDALLIAHGMIDDHVLFKDTVDLVQKLIELRKHDWWVAPYPLERHGFTHADAWYHEYRRILELLDEHERGYGRLRFRPRLPDRAAGPHLRRDRGRGRQGALRRGPLGAQGRRRRAHARAARRRRVRAGRDRLLRRLRLEAAAVGQRLAPGTGRRLLARGRRLAGVPPAQSLPADHPRQRPPLHRPARRRDRGLVVRRRLRPDPVLPVRRGRAALAPRRPRSVRALRRRGTLPGAQALVRRVVLPQAPRGDARRRRPVLRRPARRLRQRLRLHARGRRRLPRRVPADRRTAPRHPLRRAPAQLPALPPRPLRRVQPGLRSRHPVRPAVRRPRRVHPHEPAPASPLGIRLHPRPRQPRSPPRRLPPHPRLAHRTVGAALAPRRATTTSHPSSRGP